MGAEWFCFSVAWRVDFGLAEKTFGACLTAGSRPGGASYFLLLRQKKVSKEKATPGSAPLRGSLRYSRGPKCGTRPATSRFFDCYGGHEKKAKNHYSPSSTDVLPGPLEGAEQRRNAGGFGLALFEPQASLASPPAFRVAQETDAAGTDLGSPSFCLLFLDEARKSKPPRKGGNPTSNKHHTHPMPSKQQRSRRTPSC